MAKKRQTFGKMTRERDRAEKRERKLEKKAEQKQAAAEAAEAGGGGMIIGPPNQQGSEVGGPSPHPTAREDDAGSPTDDVA